MSNQNNSINTVEVKNALSLGDINKQTIREIRKGLRVVGRQKVLKRLGYTHQNLYGHLNEKNAETVNIDQLQRIIDAIDAERKILEERALRVGSKAKAA